ASVPSVGAHRVSGDELPYRISRHPSGFTDLYRPKFPPIHQGINSASAHAQLAGNVGNPQQSRLWRYYFGDHLRFKPRYSSLSFSSAATARMVFDCLLRAIQQRIYYRNGWSSSVTLGVRAWR